jgi:hypothetical protein
MHIHGNSLNPYMTGISTAAAAESAAARQRAADVRKKLMSSATDIEGVAGPDEAFMVNKWMDARHSNLLSEDEYHVAVSGKDPDLG